MNVKIRTVKHMFATLLVASTPLTAQEPRRLGLDEALELFARNSLELALQRARVSESMGTARQASAYPNPTVTASHEPLSGEARSYSETYLNVSQRLEWPGTRSARELAATRRGTAARARLTADSLRLAYEVKEAYTEAARAEVSERALLRVVVVFREGVRVAEERFREGDISRYDLERIRMERTRYELRAADAHLRSGKLRRRLTSLIDPEASGEEIAPDDGLPGGIPAESFEEPPHARLDAHPVVLAESAALAAATSTLTASRRARIPDLTATAGYKTQSDGLDGAFLGLSLPLPLWDRRGGEIEAAEARTMEAGSRLALARRRVEVDVRQALDNYRTLRARVDLLDAALPPSDPDLLEMATAAYAEGEMELVELLDAAEALLETREAEARLRAAVWISYYDLERAVGGFDDAQSMRENR